MRALPAFGLGIIVVAGIRAGVVAPTEAAALAAAYTLIAAVLKRTAVQEIGAAFRQSARETAAIPLFAPLTLPVAVSAGIDPIHFGVILVVNLMIGKLTPPVGILVQTVGNASGVPVVALFVASRPYLVALLSALALLSLSAALVACF